MATSNTSTVKTAPTVTKSVTPRKAVTSKTAAKRPVIKKVSPVKTTRQTTVRAKTAAPKKAAAPVQPAKPVKVTKVKKPKLIRDSFTIPKDEYVVIDALKLRAGKLSQAVKKSELLRAGIKALAAMSDIQFKAALSNVPTIKTGRPKNSK